MSLNNFKAQSTCKTLTKLGRSSKENHTDVPISDMTANNGNSNEATPIEVESELEEGEIADDDDDDDRNIEIKSRIKNIKDYLQSNLTGYTEKSDFENHLKSIKRKVKCKKRTNRINDNFSWSSLRVLMAGDERVVSLDWGEFKDLPSQDIYHVYECNLLSLCQLVEKHLYKKYDVAFLVGFHYDLVYSRKIFMKRERVNCSLMSLEPVVHIDELLDIVNKYHEKWKRQYPDTKIIWSLPYPVDFFKRNEKILSNNKCEVKFIDQKFENNFSKNYFDLTSKIHSQWNKKIATVPLFRFDKVLLNEKSFRISFIGDRDPQFPKNYLKSGLYCTKLMTLYCGYYFVEFLINKKIYQGNGKNIDLKEAEKILVHLYPEFQKCIKSPSKKTSHRSSNRKRRRLKKNSHHSKSRAKSPNGEDSILVCKNSSRSRSSTKDSKKESESALNSSSVISISSISSVSSIESLPLKDENDEKPNSSHIKPCSGESDKVESIDEVSFWNTLKYLKEVHDVQCSIFRRKPHTHPSYKSEKEVFMKRNKGSSPENLINKWEQFWEKRMEELFDQSWSEKKKELTEDLNKKVVFKSINSSDDKIQEDAQKESTEQNEQYNSEFIQKFLLDCQKNINTNDSIKTDSSFFQESNNRELSCSLASSQSSKEDRASSSVLVINEDLQNSASVSTKYSSPKIKDSEPSFVQSDSNLDISDFDIDIDEIMDDPEFNRGLDDLDKELKKVLPVEEKNEDKSKVGDLASIFTEKSSTDKIVYDDSTKVEFVNLLKMLMRVSKRLGPLGLSVNNLYQKASEEINSDKGLSSLNSESFDLLIQIQEKLKNFFNGHVTEVQRAIYNELLDRISSFLKKTENSSFNDFTNVNIESIASATLGSQISETVAFIKNALLYQGYQQFSSEDIMNIYMAVKASQNNLKDKDL